MSHQTHSLLDRYLKHVALETITPQLTKPVGVVPAEDYMTEMGYQRLGWRALRRRLIFAGSGQAKNQLNSLAPVGKRGLWLYFGEGQMGDALMDLAPRSLLKDEGFRMDLLTDKFIAHVFQNDPWFENVTDDASSLTEVPYDFAIVLSNKRRSLQHKRKYFRNLPWVSLLESFSGPDYHRAGYVTQRLSDLLSLDLTPAEFSRHACQKLKTQMTSDDFQSQTSEIKNAIALCLGGVDPLRTYTGWSSVISELIQRGNHEFLLVGSGNGLAEAQRLQKQFRNSVRLHDYVGKCSIAQSHDLLAAAKGVICADGGLMHLAATTSTPMVGLFSSSIRPEWRLPSRPTVAFACASSADVNDIAPHEIAEKTCYVTDQLTIDQAALYVDCA